MVTHTANDRAIRFNASFSPVIWLEFFSREKNDSQPTRFSLFSSSSLRRVGRGNELFIASARAFYPDG
jgi:hypothetical protein